MDYIGESRSLTLERKTRLLNHQNKTNRQVERQVKLNILLQQQKREAEFRSNVVTYHNEVVWEKKLLEDIEDEELRIKNRRLQKLNKNHSGRFQVPRCYIDKAAPSKLGLSAPLPSSSEAEAVEFQPFHSMPIVAAKTVLPPLIEHHAINEFTHTHTVPPPPLVEEVEEKSCREDSPSTTHTSSTQRPSVEVLSNIINNDLETAKRPKVTITTTVTTIPISLKTRSTSSSRKGSTCTSDGSPLGVPPGLKGVSPPSSTNKQSPSSPLLLSPPSAAIASNGSISGKGSPYLSSPKEVFVRK